MDPEIRDYIGEFILRDCTGGHFDINLKGF